MALFLVLSDGRTLRGASLFRNDDRVRAGPWLAKVVFELALFGAVRGYKDT